jgi:uncharacterized protein YndB with AHSA1/START domain
MADHITVSRSFAASPERVFEAWLSPGEHTKMTGSFAQLEADGAFLAWDGYITSRTLEQQPPARIVQAWRTTEFPAGTPDSRVTVTFTPEAAGTRVTIDHDDIPEGQGAVWERGWNDFYFDPMERYFACAPTRLQELSSAVEDVMHEVEQQLNQATQMALEAVEQAKEGARRHALATVSSAQALGEQVGGKLKALVKKAKRGRAKAKVAAKATRAKRAAPERLATKPKPRPTIKTNPKRKPTRKQKPATPAKARRASPAAGGRRRKSKG